MGTLANQMAAWLTSINVLLWPAPSLAAVVSVQSLTTGNTPAVTSVLCDTRPDRQEHREKAQSFRRFASVV
jgi:hypothetical protein